MGKLPVDEGYAWLVCLGASVVMIFTMGAARTFGILLIEIVTRFEAKQGLASLTLGLIAAGITVFAPLGNFIGMKLTYRVVIIIGAFITVVAAFVASFATNIYTIVICFGLFTGFGYGLLYAPTLMVIMQYFEKRRAFANGLCVAGGSFGQLFLSPLLAYLLSEYSFSGTMLILSAIAAHTIAAAALFRPTSFYLQPRRQSTLTNNRLQKVPPPTPQKAAFDKTLFKNFFYICFSLGLCLGHCGYLSMCLFIAPFAVEDLELPREQAALLLSVLAVSDLVGRIVIGWFADFHFIATNRLIALGLFVTGVTSIIVTLWTSFWTLLFLTVILGLLGALHISLSTVLLAEKLGVARTQAAFGLAILFTGICIIPVPTILGILKDETGSFKPGYQLCGIFMIIGGIFMFIGPILVKLQRSPQQSIIEVPQSGDISS